MGLGLLDCYTLSFGRTTPKVLETTPVTFEITNKFLFFLYFFTYAATELAAEGDRSSQVGSNVALGVIGVFLIVPWFFMDTNNANTVEEKAAKARFERLQQMGVDRKCPAVPAYISPNQDKQQTGTESTNPNSTGSVERIKISSQGSTTNVTNAPLKFEAARDNCSKTFKEITEQYGVCVLNSSKYKPAVVAQIGYNKVCENIGFKLDTPTFSNCVSDLMARTTR